MKLERRPPCPELSGPSAGEGFLGRIFAVEQDDAIPSRSGAGVMPERNVLLAGGYVMAAQMAAGREICFIPVVCTRHEPSILSSRDISS
ncbi:hypothetical protein B2J93_8834 [Marssonina coronariae]|uniref:Uncharacterized protein n=1 Tax=Diplocarpon coronariae TaxID=2795749 RepID=A0A218ZFI6_9HELO|nr:hypothetical protein B2J93_8834 [Marssonina coronariae]